MKERNGFVSNSSTSSYVILVAEVGNTSKDILDEINKDGLLYTFKSKYFFGRRIYEGYDDAFYFTDFDVVEKAKKAYLKMYNKNKRRWNLGPVQYANDVAYDQRWIKNVKECNEN